MIVHTHQGVLEASDECSRGVVAVNVLVPDTPSAAAVEVVRDLGALRHRVRACEDPVDDPCQGLTSGRCPLDTSPVDVSVENVVERPAGPQTEAAQRALLHELRRQGVGSDSARVVVRRGTGHLVVEVRHYGALSHTQATRLATHAAEAVRAFDPSTPTMDVRVFSEDECAGRPSLVG